MADRYQKTRYNRQTSPTRERDDRSWRQQEQFSSGERDWDSNERPLPAERPAAGGL
jgi:hypothetical protein